MPTASGLWINCSSAVYTPGSGSAVTLTRISSFSVDKGVQSVKFSGDGDRFPTLNEVVMQDPSITLAGGNVVQYVGMAAGVKGTLVVVTDDARNKTGTGSVTWTLANSQPEAASGQVPHAGLSTGTITFTSCSTDGTTNPLSYLVST